MDFVQYADLAASLVNASLETEQGLHDLLGQRAWLRRRVEPRDLAPLRRLQRELRPVFAASSQSDESAVVERLNGLLAKYPVSPHIAGHDAQTWHLHVAERGSAVSSLLIAESLMGLATLVCDYGATRLGVCSAQGCDRVFVDTSPNQSRRYCSDRCSSRANVAAYRARQRLEAAR